MTEPKLTANIHAEIEAIPADHWDALVPPGHPHLSHRFLRLAETSGSVSPETGWQPCHITLHEEDRLVAAMPLYQKAHSWGEFVFDWSWAQAYQRAGRHYYPKLVSAAPFTPATATKLLASPDADPAVRRALLQVALGFAEEHEFSSLHLQFLPESERQFCAQAGLLLRKDCQFHWFNRDYENFDEFLATFSSKKRKNVKRERRRVREAGITHRVVAGNDISEVIVERAWQLCSYTFRVRGQEPYLNLEFFKALASEPDSPLVVVLAELDERAVAAAMLLHADDVLLGRYWGAEDNFDSLHFETCYYQGIEYGIANRIQRYEPGTQGEHKIARGFVPTETGSAHWLAEPAFASAIADYLDREADGVRDYMQAVEQHVPYRSVGGDQDS